MGRRVLVVSQSRAGAHRSISAALAEAEPGATVSVLPGTYRETVLLHLPVTIMAEDRRGSVTIEAVSGSAVVMATGCATLDGLTLHDLLVLQRIPEQAVEPLRAAAGISRRDARWLPEMPDGMVALVGGGQLRFARL